MRAKVFSRTTTPHRIRLEHQSLWKIKPINYLIKLLPKLMSAQWKQLIAWLVQAVSSELEKNMPLSMKISMAISQSELGMGDGKDIYPGLYMQHTLDELQAVCAS